MIENQIVEQGGKYGLMITGEAFTGRKEEEYDYDSGRTYYRGIYETQAEWALKPEFDKIENFTSLDSRPFFRVYQHGKFGLYYLFYYAAKDKLVTSQDKKSGLYNVHRIAVVGTKHIEFEHIEFESVDFSSRHEYSVADTAIGGFILQPQHNTLEIEPDKEKYCFHIMVGAKHGLLSGRGYWGKNPIYDDIKKVAEDIFIFKLSNKYEVMRIKNFRAAHLTDNKNSIMVISRNWNKVKQSVLSSADCNDELEKIEREWQIKAKKRWSLFGS